MTTTTTKTTPAASWYPAEEAGWWEELGDAVRQLDECVAERAVTADMVRDLPLSKAAPLLADADRITDAARAWVGAVHAARAYVRTGTRAEVRARVRYELTRNVNSEMCWPYFGEHAGGFHAAQASRGAIALLDLLEDDDDEVTP